jgi:hypothetical protein
MVKSLSWLIRSSLYHPSYRFLWPANYLQYVSSWLVDRVSYYNLGLICNLMHKILVYLHIIHLLKSSTCFEHYPANLQEVYVVIVYMQPLVSSLSACDCPVHRLRKNCSFNRWTGQSLVEMTIPEAAYIYNYNVNLLRMNRVMLETCWGFS